MLSFSPSLVLLAMLSLDVVCLLMRQLWDLPGGRGDNHEEEDGVGVIWYISDD